MRFYGIATRVKENLFIYSDLFMHIYSFQGLNNNDVISNKIYIITYLMIGVT